MANEFIVRKGLIVYGSGSSTVLDVQGTQGQLFSITDSLTGSIFSANDISGIPVIEAFSDNTVKIGTFGAEGIIVSGSYSYITGSVTGSFTGSLLGTASYSVQNISSSYALTSSYTFNAISSSFASTASYVNPLRQDVQITGSLNVSGSGKFYKSSTDYVDLLTEANSISFSPNAASYIKYGSTIILAMKSGGGNSTVMYGAGTSILSATQFGVKIGRNVDGANSTSMLEVRGSGSSAGSTGLQILNANNSASFVITDDGSSRLGFEYNDTHIITGSVSINGSGSNIPLTINGRNLTSSTANKVFEVIGSSGTSVFSPRSNGLVYIATGQLYFEQNGLTSKYYDSRLELGTSIINSASTSANPQLYGGLRVFTWDGATTNIETFRVAGTGNVSIGYPSTFTNNARLHISGSTSEALLIASSSAGPALFVSGSGNVGFGTTTPTEKLHVIGNITGSGTLGIRNRTTLWGDVSLYGGNNNTSVALDYLYTGSLLGKSNVLQFRQGGSTPGAIMFTYYGTNSMLTMIPSDFPSARVGINTPNPQATLHVSGSSGSVVFEVDSNSSPNIIYASGSGNVGFGTSTPTEKVHVVGNGLFTGDLTVQGKITAEEFYTEYVSSSVIYRSGSTKFGDTLDDTHQFTGSVRITGSATINNYTLPLTDGTNKQIIITDGLGNLAFDFNRTLYEEVKNVSGGTLAKGTPVHVVSTTGNTNNVIAASASLASTMPATFILDQALNNDEEGLGIILGHINGVNTSAFNEGDVVYVGPNGGYTNQRPTGSNLVQPLGIVIKVDASNGSGLVMNPGVTNDTPNLLNGQIFWGEGNTAIQKPLRDILSGSAYAYSGSFTGSLLGTSSYAVQSLSASLAESASYYPIKVSGSTIYSADPATSGFNTTGAVLIGPNSVGQNSTNSQFAVMVGAAAGQNATTSQYAVMIGTSAGNGASNSEYGVMLGRWAGSSATNASSSVMVGREAGRNATNTTLSTFVGAYAGFGATNARSSTFIGQQAGYNASSANDSVFVGTNAGYGATAAVQSLFYGPNAGFQASAATLSTFIGNESGYNAISGSYSVFIGNLSGQNATSASFSTFIGRQAGQAATKASSATFIGGVAGYAATFANNGVFVGNSAGESAASASYSILIGNNAGATSNAANTIGSYNTVIGTGISVPKNATRALNIGGLIFGTGSYASANLDAFSGSANGRVGINQPLPQKEFDISGSVRISSLATNLTAPATSGRIQAVITDVNGDLSFTDLCCSGSESGSVKIVDDTTDLGSATYLKFTGDGVTTTVVDSTASISIPGGGSSSSTMNVVYITGSATQLRISSGSINTYYRISTTGAFEVAIPTNSSRPGIPTGSQIIIEKLITGSLILTAESGVGYTGSLYIPYQYQTLTLTKVNTDEWVGVGGYDNQIITFNSQSSTSYTLVKEDVGKMIRLNNASSITVTVPPNSSQAFPIGSIVSMEQQGAGVITCITGSGVTINSTARKSWGQYTVIQVYKVGTDTWNVIGGVD